MSNRYRRPRSEKCSSSGSSSSERGDSKNDLPRGRPYITKINGRLVMARDKRPRPPGSTLNLLGSAFGLDTRIIRRRSQSVDSLPSPTAPLMIAGEPHIPLQQHLLTNSTPLFQNGFLPITHPNMISIPQIKQPEQFLQPGQYQQTIQATHLMLREPMRYIVEAQAAPSNEDIEDLKHIHAHFTVATGKDRKVHKSVGSVAIHDVNQGMVANTTLTVVKHACANCGRIRSRKYHHENPIKPGEVPMPAFCKKCQRDASSTSSEDRARVVTKSKIVKNNCDNVRLLVLTTSHTINRLQKKVNFKTPDAESDIADAQRETVSFIPAPINQN